MLSDSLRIPKSRLAALIGHLGKTKQDLQKQTHTQIRIDSETGEIQVKAKTDAIGFYSALNIVKAIGRGFSPEHAFLLLNENTGLEIISLDEWFGQKKSAMHTKRSRVIGTSGKVRQQLEDKTNCFISVQGKTIALIGEYEDLQTAKNAVEMLLSGARHATVYEKIDRQNKDKKFEL